MKFDKTTMIVLAGVAVAAFALGALISTITFLLLFDLTKLPSMNRYIYGAMYTALMDLRGAIKNGIRRQQRSEADPDGVMETVRTKVDRPGSPRLFLGIRAEKK